MCPAYRATCTNCGKRNLFARQRKQRKVERTRGRAQQVHFMNNEDCADDSEDLYGMELVEACEIKREKKWLVD